jgi:hypothetical protein
MFERPPRPKTKKRKIKTPYEFDPSQADQRAGPSVAAGDYYGTAVKNPMGRIRDASTPGFNPLSKNKLGKPPKSIA